MKKHRKKIREVEELNLVGARIIRPSGKSFRSYIPYDEFLLQAESGLEEKLYDTLIHDPNVEFIYSQPEKLPFNYTPDIRVDYKDGKIIIIEVKHSSAITEREIEKWARARSYYKEKGWEFRVMTEKDITNIRWLNIQFFSNARSEASSKLSDLIVAKVHGSGGLYYSEILLEFSSEFAQEEICYCLNHLIYKCKFAINWDEIIDIDPFLQLATAPPSLSYLSVPAPISIDEVTDQLQPWTELYPLRDLEEAGRRLIVVLSLLDERDEATIERAKDQLDRSRSTVYDLLKTFESSNHAFESLIPRHKDKGPNGSTLDVEILEAMDEIIKKNSTSSKRRNITETYDQLKDILQEKCPHFQTFYRYLKSKGRFADDERHYGSRDAKLRTSMKIAESPEVTILECVEFDNVVIDPYVESDDGTIFGKCWLTHGTDRYSRITLGWHLGFEDPSAYSALKSLQHVMSEKNDDYPYFGVPKKVSMDNGLDFDNFNVMNFSKGMAMTLGFRPTYSPYYGGIAERHHRSLNDKLRLDFPDSFTKDGTPIKFSILEEYIAQYFYERSQIVHKGLNARPSDVWQEAMNGSAQCRARGRLIADQVVLERLVLERTPKDRTLQRVGIEYNRIVYSSSELLQLQQEFGLGINLKLRVDRNDARHIFVEHPTNELRLLRIPAVKGIPASLDCSKPISAKQMKISQKISKMTEEERRQFRKERKKISNRATCKPIEVVNKKKPTKLVAGYKDWRV